MVTTSGYCRLRCSTACVAYSPFAVTRIVYSIPLVSLSHARRRVNLRCPLQPRGPSAGGDHPASEHHASKQSAPSAQFSHLLNRKCCAARYDVSEQNCPHARALSSRPADSCPPAMRQFRPCARKGLQRLLSAFCRTPRETSGRPHGPALFRPATHLDRRTPSRVFHPARSPGRLWTSRTDRRRLLRTDPRLHPARGPARTDHAPGHLS